jgi:hypothetical protein
MRLSLIVAAFVLTACGGATTTEGPADECGAAFAAAAGVDEMADTVADLYPAVRACTTIAAWSAAFDANGGAGFTGSATEVLRNACTAPEIANEPLCMSAQ